MGKVGGDHSAAVAQVAKEVPGIRTIISVNGPSEMVAVPYVDIVMPNHAFPITEETVRFVKEEHRKELWLFNIGTSRFSYGFYPWRVGAKGRYQYHARDTLCFPYNDFDSFQGESIYMKNYPVPDGPPKATVKMEELREGIYDYRYVRTLELILERAGNSGDERVKSAADQARALLSEIRGSIDWDIRTHWTVKVSAEEAGTDMLRSWDAETCERYRWLIARAIMNIERYLD